MKLGMLIAMIALVVLFGVGLTLDSRAYKKQVKKDAEETNKLYQEATEWYNQLSTEKKADIMDYMWENCPSPKNGKKYMISIYLYYTEQKEAV